MKKESKALSFVLLMIFSLLNIKLFINIVESNHGLIVKLALFFAIGLYVIWSSHIAYTVVKEPLGKKKRDIIYIVCYSIFMVVYNLLDEFTVFNALTIVMSMVVVHSSFSTIASNKKA